MGNPTYGSRHTHDSRQTPHANPQPRGKVNEAKEQVQFLMGNPWFKGLNFIHNDPCPCHSTAKQYGCSNAVGYY
jgi:hypothetical protein